MTDREIIESKVDDARKIIENSGILDDGKIKKIYRSYLSSFGAAVIMGTSNAAISGFWNSGGANENGSTDKHIVVSWILSLLSGIELNREKDEDEKVKPSLNEVLANFSKYDQEEILNAAASLKVACDLFEREDDRDGS